MISLRHSLWIGTLALGTAIVVGCGGGTAVTPSAPSAPHGASKAPVAVKIAIVVPAAAHTATAAIKHRMAIAQGTQGIQFVIYTHPQASNPVALQTDAFDISATSSNCTVQSDTSRLCTLALDLSPGTYDIDATSYDTAPSAGVIPGSAHSLGYAALVAFAVAQGAANTMNLSIDGIASSVTVTLPEPVVRGLTTISQQAAVTVLDANGDVILSNGYVDGSGNAVTVALSDAASTGLVSFGSSTIATPPPAGVTVTYNPASMSSTQMTSGATAQITATLSSGPTGSQPLTIAAPAAPIALASPAAHGITSSNGIVYVPLSMASHPPMVAAITASGTVTTFPVATSGATPEPYDIAVGADGNLWMSDASGNHIIESGITGAPYQNVSGFSGGGSATSIVSDGTMTLWALSPSNTSDPVWEIPLPSGTPLSSLPLNPPNSPAPAAMAYNAGNLWITETNANAVEEFSTSSVASVNRFSIPSSGANPLGIAVGPNGDMWFAETATDKIGDFNGASFAEYATGGVSPSWVITGPDGNLWFDYTSPSPGIGRMSSNGSTVARFPLPSGVLPGEMTVSSGLIWIVDTESSNPRVFAIQP